MKKCISNIEMKRNLTVLFIIFMVVFFGVTGRIIYIVANHNQAYQTNVLSQQINKKTSSDEIIAKRGSITDRNGIVLSESIKVYNVIYDPGVLKYYNADVIASTNKILSENIPITIGELEKIFTENPNSSYEILMRAATHDAVKGIETKILEGNMKGVFLESYYVRTYPYNQLASDVLGFYSNASGGSYGVEQYYDQYLSGSNGRLFGSYDEQSILRQEEIAAENGNDVVLTIDYTIQKIVEDAILNYTLEHKAKSVNVIMMNPQNGEIVAMASYPNFDLNNPYDLSNIYEESALETMSVEEKNKALYEVWKNFSITDSYEPGSTFKPFVLAAALESGTVTLEQLFTCDGYKVLYDYVIRCWKTSGHGEETASEALSNSCNVAFMEIGEALGRDAFYQYEELFGFGEKTKVDLIGEGEGIMYNYDQLQPVEMATSSFGQGFNITPIQLITAFSALTNGGYLYEPHIMKKIVDEDQNLVEQKEVRIIRQAVSSEISEMISNELKTVVDVGTGKKAAVEGYTVGGKTGTAQKGNRDDEKYIISFIGFTPVYNAELIGLVVIDEPEGNTPDSGQASKVFAEIMTKVLPYKGIFPEVVDNLEDAEIISGPGSVDE